MQSGHRTLEKTGTFTAIDNASITIPEGSIFGVLGPNGAGKTTTIRMLTGVLQPGAVTVQGIPGNPQLANTFIVNMLNKIWRRDHSLRRDDERKTGPVKNLGSLDPHPQQDGC